MVLLILTRKTGFARITGGTAQMVLLILTRKTGLRDICGFPVTLPIITPKRPFTVFPASLHSGLTYNNQMTAFYRIPGELPRQSYL